MSLPRSEFRRGEPIPIKFEIANDGPHTYSISSPGIRPVVGIGITLKRGDRKLVEPLPGAIVAGGAVQTLAPGEAVATDPGAEVPCSLGPDGIPEFDRGCQAPPGVYRVETIFAGGISRVAEDGTRRFVVDLSAPPVEFTIVE